MECFLIYLIKKLNNTIMRYRYNNVLLDKYQTRAVLCDEKYYLVVAGAGSGKTLTICAKIDYLLNNGIKKNNILCLSFTNETVNNLKAKLEGVDVMTFHKFALNYLPNNNYKICNDYLLKYIIDEYFESIIYDGTNKLLDVYLAENEIIKEKFIQNFKNICLCFIHTLKAYNYNLNDLYTIIKKTNSFEDKVLLIIIFKIYYLYEEEKTSQNLIDFDDLLILASSYISKIKFFKYKYIIIDEYQDTSPLRFNLIKTIIENFSINLICFGDDFQSIYGFNGCNLDIFLNFKKNIGGKILKLKYTYRCPKDIVDISYRFIKKNKKQLRKQLISTRYIKNSINVIYTKNITKTYYEIIENIDNILILGRNNKDINLINNGNISYKNKIVRFLTVHSSKGLESDYVIIINLIDDYLGFPNKIKENNIFKYIKKDEYLEEERRLFYVALTRCKNKVFLLTNKANQSEFINELFKDYKFKIKTFNFN